jgi:hypothetical protein
VKSIFVYVRVKSRAMRTFTVVSAQTRANVSSEKLIQSGRRMLESL